MKDQFYKSKEEIQMFPIIGAGQRGQAIKGLLEGYVFSESNKSVVILEKNSGKIFSISHLDFNMKNDARI